MTLAWTQGSAPSWAEAYGLTTPKATFYHLTGTEGWRLSNQRGVDLLHENNGYFGAERGDYVLSLRAYYYYLDGTVYKTAEASLASAGVGYLKSRHRLVTATRYDGVAVLDGRPASVLRREAAGADSWRWVVDVWSEAAEAYRTVWVAPERRMPACAFWRLADDFADQIAAGDWGSLQPFVAESPAWRRADYCVWYQEPITSRVDTLLERSATGITLSGGNEADRVRGHYVLLDPTATGTARVWVHGAIWHNDSPFRATGDNAALKALFDAAPSPLASTEPRWADACEDSGWNYAIIRHTGSAWVLAYNETVTWTADGDPDAAGTLWTGATGHSDCLTRAWNSWHRDTTTRYGLVRDLITDGGDHAVCEIGCMRLRAMIGFSDTYSPRPQDIHAPGLYGAECIAMPGREHLCLRLDAAAASDVQNDYLCLFGLEAADIDEPRMARSYGTVAEQDHLGQFWTDTVTRMGEDFYPFTEILPIVQSLRYLEYGLYRCKVETLIEVGWDTSDEDELQAYEDAFAAAFSGGADDGYADYPDFTGVEPTQPNASAANDGALRGAYAGYQRGFESAQRDDEIAGYDAGCSDGIAQAQLDDPDYSPNPPAPPAGTETFQAYYAIGWMQGYDTWWGYASYDPPPALPVGDWGASFYVPSAYWTESGSQNISGLTWSIRFAGSPVASGSGSDTGQSVLVGGYTYYLWSASIVQDVTTNGIGSPTIDSVSISVPADTDTTRYTPIQGPGWAEYENGSWPCLTRAAPIIRPTGAAATPEHECGLYDPSLVASGYTPPTLPPVWPVDPA